MSLINWRLPVADKEVFWEVFWDTLKTYKGWKFQHNTVIGQYRVVSPQKYREAWGFDKPDVLDDFERLSGYGSSENWNDAPPSSSTSTTSDSLSKVQLRKELDEELIRIAHLLEIGALTNSEYQERKKMILKDMDSLK